MDKLIWIIAGLLIAGIAAYFGVRRLISSTESSNLNYMENTIRTAFAGVAANRLHTSTEEVQRALSRDGSASTLGRQLREELLKCQVRFEPPVKNIVHLTLLISWKDGQVVKVEQDHEWEMLPEDVRASLIRSRHPYESSWSLPS